MPVSGLILTLANDPARRRAALDALAQHASVELGSEARDDTASRIAIVVDTASSEDDRDVWEWLHTLPGVEFVDLACVHFEDADVVDDGHDEYEPPSSASISSKGGTP